MKIEKKGGLRKPDRLTRLRVTGVIRYTLASDIVERTVDGLTGYEWSEATFTPGIPEYGDVVAAIIKGRYTDDEMTAIINNHLLDGDDEINLAEWNAMQEWRAEAKKQAKEILEEINKME